MTSLQRQPAPGAHADGATRSLLTLESELTQLGLMTAVAGSIANALESGAPCRFAADAILSFVPRAEVMRPRVSVTEHVALDAELQSSLRSFSAIAGVARALTESFAYASADEADIATIADAWRRASSLFVVVLYLLNRSLDGAGLGVRAPLSFGATRLLKDVCRGASPCLAGDGGLHIPGWAERRKTSRARTDVTVQIVQAGFTSTAVLRNASSNGVGLQVDHDLVPGSDLLIALGDGVEAHGTVIWCHDGLAGVRLHAPIGGLGQSR